MAQASPELDEQQKAVRHCVGCAQSDTHPRHGIGLALWHMDCHVTATGCDTCARQLADAAGATGDALQAHLLTLPKED